MKNNSKMSGIKWKKAPQWLVDTFDEVLPDDPRIERRKMFGYPCAFANGNMFAGLFQSDMVLRLPEKERAGFSSEFDSGPFEPMPGHVMKEYVTIPGDLFEERDELDRWLKISLEYVSKLPRKTPKKKTKKA